MSKGHEVAKDFYEAFSRRDAAAMNRWYSEGAEFWDPVFENLDGRRTRAMWEMICTNARNFSLTFRIIEASDRHAQVEWVATYDFSMTGRRVVNKIATRMEFANGLIARQVDQFDFPTWARQAFGFAGIVLGRLPPFKRKVQRSARAGLEGFLKKQH
jgi:ketosteroid isomerase-like protein